MCPNSLSPPVHYRLETLVIIYCPSGAGTHNNNARSFRGRISCDARPHGTRKGRRTHASDRNASHAWRSLIWANFILHFPINTRTNDHCPWSGPLGNLCAANEYHQQSRIATMTKHSMHRAFRVVSQRFRTQSTSTTAALFCDLNTYNSFAYSIEHLPVFHYNL